MNETAHEHDRHELHPHEVGGSAAHAHPPSPLTPAAAPAAMKDPVCGMTVTDQSPHVLEHAGAPVYFCSAGCKAKFAANPAQYLTAPTAVAAPPLPLPEPAIAGTVYTCPMHPEVRQDHPGACPKCGMALEPEMPTLDDGESPELLDFKRRFIWTLPLTIIVTVQAMSHHREHGDDDGQRQRPDESPFEVQQLGVLALVERGHLGLQRHAAFRTSAGVVLPHFRVHRAGVGGAGDCGFRCRR